jgi:predicted P-loop ATPase
VGSPMDEDDDYPPLEFTRDQKVVPLRSKRRTPDDWRAAWQVAETGTPLPNLKNTLTALRASPELLGIVAYDEMARAPMLVRRVPGTAVEASLPRELRDADVIAIQEEIQALGLRRVPKGTVQDALDLAASQNRYHPVKQYLAGLPAWDGVSRTERFLPDYLGCPDDDYHRTIGRLFLIAMIARIYEPGCQADYMLVLEGPQGALKSSALRALAGQWFDDNLPHLTKGDHVRLKMHLRGKWLIEIAELSAFGAAEVEILKEFITGRVERYVPKYGRQEVVDPRQCLLAGSTNQKAYLRDETGGRRFWPAAVGTILLALIEQDRDQLFAEALGAYRAGAKWYPSREFEAQHIKPQQDARYEADAWEDAIAHYVNHEEYAIPFVKVTDVLVRVLNIELGRITSREYKRVSKIFTRLGWIESRTEIARGYRRPAINSASRGIPDGDDR